MARSKRLTLPDGTRVKDGMILQVDHKKSLAKWEGVQVKVLETFDWEAFCIIIKTGKSKGAHFRLGRKVWFDLKRLFRIEGGALVEHLRSLVSVSRK